LLSGWRGADPARALCLEAAAEICFDEIQPARAYLYLDEAIALRPDDAELHFKKGKALYDAGREREAEVALRECLALDWSRDRAKILLARILYEAGSLEKAAAFLDTVGEDHAWTASDLVLLGAVRHESGRTEEALEFFARAAEADPSLPEPAFNEGLIFEEREDPAAAEESYRRALRADPRHVPSLFNLGRLMAAAGKNEAAEFLMTEACRLEMNPNRRRSLEKTRDRLLQAE
jgi:Flp pilus assembly protein TadD